jgi:hypothetical protein
LGTRVDLLGCYCKRAIWISRLPERRDVAVSAQSRAIRDRRRPRNSSRRSRSPRSWTGIGPGRRCTNSLPSSRSTGTRCPSTCTAKASRCAAKVSTTTRSTTPSSSTSPASPSPGSAPPRRRCRHHPRCAAHTRGSPARHPRTRSATQEPWTPTWPYPLPHDAEPPHPVDRPPTTNSRETAKPQGHHHPVGRRRW